MYITLFLLILISLVPHYSSPQEQSRLSNSSEPLVATSQLATTQEDADDQEVEDNDNSTPEPHQNSIPSELSPILQEIANQKPSRINPTPQIAHTKRQLQLLDIKLRNLSQLHQNFLALKKMHPEESDQALMQRIEDTFLDEQVAQIDTLLHQSHKAFHLNSAQKQQLKERFRQQLATTIKDAHPQHYPQAKQTLLMHTLNLTIPIAARAKVTDQVMTPSTKAVQEAAALFKKIKPEKEFTQQHINNNLSSLDHIYETLHTSASLSGDIAALRKQLEQEHPHSSPEKLTELTNQKIRQIVTQQDKITTDSLEPFMQSFGLIPTAQQKELLVEKLKEQRKEFMSEVDQIETKIDMLRHQILGYHDLATLIYNQQVTTTSTTKQTSWQTVGAYTGAGLIIMLLMLIYHEAIFELIDKLEDSIRKAPYALRHKMRQQVNTLRMLVGKPLLKETA